MYNEILKEITLEYSQLRNNKEKEQKIRKKEVYNKVPAIENIDDKIQKIGLNMSKMIIADPTNAKEHVEKAKEKIEKLKMEKAFLLTECNIPLDYMELKYNCEVCKDQGYLENGKQCNCLKQQLVSRAYQMSNLENVLEKENFQSFDLNIFSDEKFENEILTPKENMSDILGISEAFIDSFDKNNGQNLLFYGTTGLGKTFLCNCIAKSLLDRNKIVVYQTAFTILDILENRRFGKKGNTLDDYQYKLLLDSDLLIVDDLGTEMTNTFTNAEIFNIINTRIIKGKKTIISSNLTPKEISDTYTDRVFSRVLQNFIPLKFYGKDLRWE